MHYQLCVSVMNNWDKHVTFCKKNAKSMTFYLVSSTLLEYIWEIAHIWRRWGKPQNFFLAFINELEKQLIIKKKLLRWVSEKQNNLNIYNVAFLKKKIKRSTCRYHYQNLNDMIYGSENIELNILKLVIWGHFLPFYPIKNLQNQNFEKWKNLLEI